MKNCTNLTLFYFKRVIKVRAEKNKNAIISNISELCQIIIFDPIPTEIDDVRNTIENILHFRNNFDEKDIKTSKSSPLTPRSKSLKLIKTFKTKYSKSPRTSRTPKTSTPEVTTLIAISSPKETKDSKEKIEISLIIFSDSDLKITKSEETEYSYLNLILNPYLDPWKILETIFTDPFGQEFEENQKQQNSLENSEEETSSEKEISNNESNLKIYI